MITISENELLTLKNIIDVTSARGAFKPDEFAAVGQIYQTVKDKLKEVQNQPVNYPDPIPEQLEFQFDNDK